MLGMLQCLTTLPLVIGNSKTLRGFSEWKLGCILMYCCNLYSNVLTTSLRTTGSAVEHTSESLQVIEGQGSILCSE